MRLRPSLLGPAQIQRRLLTPGIPQRTSPTQPVPGRLCGAAPVCALGRDPGGQAGPGQVPPRGPPARHSSGTLSCSTGGRPRPTQARGRVTFQPRSFGPSLAAAPRPRRPPRGALSPCQAAGPLLTGTRQGLRTLVRWAPAPDVALGRRSKRNSPALTPRPPPLPNPATAPAADDTGPPVTAPKTRKQRPGEVRVLSPGRTAAQGPPCPRLCTQGLAACPPGAAGSSAALGGFPPRDPPLSHTGPGPSRRSPAPQPRPG